jgi:16S rRNA (adenine1518-N6/adenine1519-N6)-dimethyltransferase
MKKSFGQHFLHDPNVITRIIEHIPSNQPIVEVGPGSGALTKFLSQKTNNLTLIEADRDLLPKLQAEYSNTTIISGDAASVDYNQFSPDTVFVSNLPYNSAAAILMKVLSAQNGPSELFIMVQKEQADRMLDKFPKKRSILTIATQIFAETKFLLHVGPGAFNPPPKVDSSVLYLRKRAGISPDIAEKAIMLAKIAFNERRKQLGTSLKEHVDLSNISAKLQQMGFSLQNRPADLSPLDWLKLI